MKEGQGHLGNRHNRAWKARNKTELLLACRVDPGPAECRSHWVQASEIPPVVARDYFTFSFVRNPFARVLSAYREVNAELLCNTYYLGTCSRNSSMTQLDFCCCLLLSSFSLSFANPNGLSCIAFCSSSSSLPLSVLSSAKLLCCVFSASL